jgi:hypothetical protein
MSRFSRIVLPALLAALVSSAARADIAIDSFGTSQGPVSNTTPSTSVSNGAAAAGAIGGDRVITVTNGANVFSSSASVTGPLNRFDFSSQTSPPSNASMFVLKYDGTTSSSLTANGLGGINTSSVVGVNLTGSNSSSGVETVLLTYYTDATHVSTATVSIPSGASNQAFFVPIGSFVGTANLSSLGAFTATVSYAGLQGSSGAFTILSFSTVPEPSPLALASLFGGLVGAGRMFLRRKSA